MNGFRVARPDGVRVGLPSLALPVDLAAAQVVWNGALCAQTDPELFFPARGDAEQSRQAVAVCGRCQVRALCLATFGPALGYGVVGGRTADERTRQSPLDRTGPARRGERAVA